LGQGRRADGEGRGTSEKDRCCFHRRLPNSCRMRYKPRLARVVPAEQAECRIRRASRSVLSETPRDALQFGPPHDGAVGSWFQ
jgi:hypothetical protein